MYFYEASLYLTLAIYSILYDWRPLMIYLGLMVAYVLAGYVAPGLVGVPTRRKLTFSSWSKPSEGSILMRYEVNMAPIKEYLALYPAETRPSFNHVVIKAVGQAVFGSDLNGSIAFGRFRPYDGCSVSTLVDINGRDLASITVEHVEKLTIEEIREATHGRAKHIKQAGGDA
jgi:hypothetical protein